MAPRHFARQYPLQEIASRGWEIMDEIEQKALQEYDEKRTEPGKPDPTQIIPEIGS